MRKLWNFESAIIRRRISGRSARAGHYRWECLGPTIRLECTMSAEVRNAKIGVLAYGSLIDDPGPELGPAIASTLSVETPFCVEYARSSQSRGGAPTLVPVNAGGAKVAAVIQILNDSVSVEQAKDWLWRREARRYGQTDHYVPNLKPGKNTVAVEILTDFYGVQVVLYTRIGANISPLNAVELARLAVQSAQKRTVTAGKDGISYLLNAKKHGIRTPLTEDYENAILSLTGEADLLAALKRARATADDPTAADRAAIVRAFCEDCVWAKAIRAHFTQLFESGDKRGALLQEVAGTFFHDLNLVLLEYILLQQYKLVDEPSAGSGKDNLSTNYLLSLGWTDQTHEQLSKENETLLAFRAQLAIARRTLIAHTDLRARLQPIAPGSLVESDELAFWNALQRFVDAAHEEAVGGPFEIDASMPDGDAASLIHCLVDGIDYSDIVAGEPAFLGRRLGKRRFDGA